MYCFQMNGSLLTTLILFYNVEFLSPQPQLMVKNNQGTHYTPALALNPQPQLVGRNIQGTYYTPSASNRQHQLVLPADNGLSPLKRLPAAPYTPSSSGTGSFIQHGGLRSAVNNPTFVKVNH